MKLFSDVSETSSLSSDEVFAKKIVPGTDERKLALIPLNACAYIIILETFSRIPKIIFLSI